MRISQDIREEARNQGMAEMAQRYQSDKGDLYMPVPKDS